ncbi:OB-fold nucleic acid binding domain-containing protein [Ornithinimicrobium cavernae]|uniref:OB-fold nucleic acid binding domain-containing protein n=1 Tax=Ornithinimicrobium cavernae TaxID=2666047 RepID=UPI000D698FF0|nr:OB-fold nucleic acid binding domain-containing protein [Ornithinimicrobium cavernae]
MSLRKALDDLAVDSSELEAEELAAECARPGCTRIADLQVRSLTSVTGTVHSIAVLPADRAPELRIELWDGTGILEVIWLGRREITGIRPGAYLTLTGRVTMVDGRRTIFNPGYQMLPSNA